MVGVKGCEEDFASFVDEHAVDRRMSRAYVVTRLIAPAYEPPHITQPLKINL